MFSLTTYLNTNTLYREFPGSPVVRTHTSTAGGTVPGGGTKIPQAVQHGQKEKKRKKLIVAIKFNIQIL